MAVDDAARRDQERRVEVFYRAPEVRGASEFGLGMTGLAITNVKAVGHKFRKILGDPAARRVDWERGGEAAGTKTIPERVVRAPNFLPAVFLDLGSTRARSVCKIETHGVDFQGVAGRWFGTGFLVAPDVLLTNHHVVHSIDAAREAWCIFNFEIGADNRPMETAAVRLQPERLFVTSPLQGGLDYTFIGIDKDAVARFGFIPLLRNAFTVHPGDAANIIQHPEGRHKEVTLQENEVLQDTGVLLHYASDTLGGSSGSPVFNNRWELIALHHASRKNDEKLRPNAELPAPEYVNEGIKISAIAADLEARVEAGKGVTAARAALKIFGGVDSLLGFFGALGRHPEPPAASTAPAALADASPRAGAVSGTGIERIVGTYSGEGQDLDVVFWNVEWFTNCFQEKAGSLAEVIVDLNADVWALLDCSIDAARALIDQLRQDYDLDFGCAFAEPNASAGARSTSVIWNMATTVGERLAWPNEIDEWFQVDSQQFGDLRLEAAHGRVFERYPGFFRVQAANRPGDADPFELLLVPLRLQATQEGTARRRLAARILAAAVMKEIARGEARDWIIGGDYAADLATQEFRAMIRDGFVPLSAAEIGPGAMTYLKSARSLIDHIFLSHNLVRTFGADDFFVTAGDRELPEYIGDLSDRLPVLLRLSLSKTLPKAASLPPSLASALGLA